jgi:hypothetical protein
VTVAGSGPFELTDRAGRQVSIPLVALKITSGVVAVDGAKWPPYAGYSGGDQAVIASLLGEYAAQQQLGPAPAASVHPALTFTAAAPGVFGNNIAVDIAVTASATQDPTAAAIGVTVTEKEVYTNLTVATVVAVLGNGKTVGTQPGLATVQAGSVDATRLPKDAQTGSFPDPGAPGAFATFHIVDDANPAVTVFTLAARASGSGAQFTKATISAVNAGAKTFTLTLEWQHAVTGAKLPTLVHDLAPLGYEIAVTPPPSGIFSVPAPTPVGAPVTLSGGTATKPASATVFTSN